MCIDGGDSAFDCDRINHIQYTISPAILIHGSAIMYNVTNGSEQWRNRTQTLVKSISVFFTKDIMREVSCESSGNCHRDMYFFKGIFASSLAATAQMAPFTSSEIIPRLEKSAHAAATTACANEQVLCSFEWAPDPQRPTTNNLGPQFSALQVIQANFVPFGGKLASHNSSSSSPGTESGIVPDGVSPGNSTAAPNKPDSSGGKSLFEFHSHYPMLAAFLILAVVLMG